MLRYNNQGVPAKPVDYYRPLTVDVSVEYELPKEVAPPKGSAPLLIIHPSAYFRSKQHPTFTTNPSMPPTPPKSGPPASRTSSARLGDIASTLYYLSTGAGLPAAHSQQQSHIKTLRSSYANQHISSTTGSSTGSSTNMRYRTQAVGSHAGPTSSNCGYGNCDECLISSSGRISAHLPLFVAGNRVGGSSNEGSPIKKSHPHQASDRAPYSSTINGSNGSFLMSNSVHGSSGSSLIGSNPGGLSYLGNSVITPNPNASTASSSNKRLRMMSQQQAHQKSVIMSKTPPQTMEPLNLAITPSASSANASHHHNQFSTFLGYGLPNSGRVNGGPIPPLGPLHYGSTFPNNSNTPNNIYAAQAARYSKEIAVPVDRGSGSDSGVCSENDSDVSPPMALQDHQRRSVISQDLSSSSSGCYCCCCPTTSIALSSRKSSSTSQSTGSWSSSKGSRAGRNQQSTSIGQQDISSSSSVGRLANYESLISVLQQQHEAQFSAESAMMPMSLGNSPITLDSGTNMYQQRKLFTAGSAPVLAMDTLNTSSVSRWFQV